MENKLAIKLPEHVNMILNTLEKTGFEGYAVGGCVRDSILGRVPGDWDITTSARPEQVKALFPRTIDTGLQHGTVTVMMGRVGYEVTTYRVDGKYEDGRHPKEVTFTPSLKEDLKRRDFTVNAMAYNDREGLVDLFGGLEDLKTGILRCVGDPLERFSEDALRMMRAVRFSAQLGMEIEEATALAARKLSEGLKLISAERIQTELVKLAVSPHPDYLRKAYALGLTALFLPEFDLAMETPQNHPHHCRSVGEHTLHTMLETPPEKNLRLAALFHDIGKPVTQSTDGKGITHFYGHGETGADMTRMILRRLKFDNDTVNRVCSLVRFHDYGNGAEPDRRLVRRAMNKIGGELFPELFALKRADILAQSSWRREDKLAALERWELVYGEIVAEQECVSLKELAVTGKDLIALGMQPGREIGETLKMLLELVLDNPETNEREVLLRHVKEGRTAAPAAVCTSSR